MTASKKILLLLVGLVVFAGAARSLGMGKPYLGNFNSYQLISASMSRNFIRENFTDLLNPKLDVLVEGGPGLHLHYYPVASLAAAAGAKIFGGAWEVWGRLQAIFFSLGTIVLLYLWGARLRDPAFGLVAAAVVAVSPVSVIYGQSFMNEAGGVFLVVLSLFSFWRFRQAGSPGRGWLVCGMLSAALALVTRLNAFYLFLPLAVLWINGADGKWDVRRVGSWVAVCVLIGLLPLAWYGYTYLEFRSNPHVYNCMFAQLGRQAPSALNWEFFRTVFQTMATLDFTPPGLALLIAGLWLVRRQRAWVWIYAWFFGALGTFVLMPQKIVDHNFYSLHLVAPAALFIAAAVEILWKKFAAGAAPAARVAIAAVVLVVGVGWSARYFYHPVAKSVLEENTGVVRAGQVIERLTGPHEKIIAAHGSSNCLLYYSDRRGWDFMVVPPAEVPYQVLFRWRFESPQEIERRSAIFRDPRLYLEYLRKEGAAVFAAASMGELDKNPAFKEYLLSRYPRIDADGDPAIVFDLRDSSPATADEIKACYPTFSTGGLECAFNAFHVCRDIGRTTMEYIFSDPLRFGDACLAQAIRDTWNAQKRAMEEGRPELEPFFGKEFFDAFLRYQQDATDGIWKYMNRDCAGARMSLEKAKATAKQFKRIPVNTPNSFSPLFADKMVLETDICLGVTECMRGNVPAGMAALRAAGEEASRAKWPGGEAQAAYTAAHYAQWAKLPAAKALYYSALEIARKNKIHHYIWKGCWRLAKIHLQEGNVELAISLLEEAVVSTEFLRTKLESDAERIQYMSNRNEVNQLLIAALLDKGEIRKALEVSENAKSRILKDLLDSAHVFGLHGVKVTEHFSMLTKEQVLAEKIEDLENTQERGAERKLAALRQAHDDVVAQIRRNNPDYGVMKVGGTMDVNEIQAALDEKTALIEYYLLPEYLIAWLVTKHSFRVKKIPLSEATLTQKVQSIRMMMGKPKVPAVYKLLGQLYRSILQPFDKEIRGKNIILVPDSVLHYVPFAALMDPKGKFLAENHAISVVPTFTILKLCMAKHKSVSKTILAFGNPDLQDAKLDLPNAQIEVKSIAERFPKLGPSVVLRSDPKANLPNAKQEVQKIAEKFPQTEAYFRKEATETLAKQVMGNFDIVHFACHGEMDQQNGTQSCLRLAPSDGDDGKLTAGEIFDLKLNAQLVILSGCETGRGVLERGDEMIGLTRSFIYAGTPSIVVSLWKVDDSATSLFMVNFYKNLAKMGKAEALRQAQIETMKVKKHPYYWAAFYLVGDGR